MVSLPPRANKINHQTWLTIFSASRGPHVATYADIAAGLDQALPKYDAGRTSFRNHLLDRAHAAFKEMLENRRKGVTSVSADGMLVNLFAFIGHLFARDLINCRIFSTITNDLVGMRSFRPSATDMECAAVLFRVSGKKLDAGRVECMLLTQYLRRFAGLANVVKADGTWPPWLYPQRIRDMSQALAQARSDGWPPLSGQVVLRRLQKLTNTEPKTQEQEMRIVSAVSGRVVAVLPNPNHVLSLRQEISAITGISKERICLLEPVEA